MNIRLKSEKDIPFLRESGHILATTLKAVSKKAVKDVSLLELDALAHDLILRAGGTPSFLGYKPEGARKAYPASMCLSLNEKIVHGIPSKEILKEGDILKLDLGVNFKGYFTDAAVTVGIGTVSDEKKELLQVTKKALENAIRVCRPGGHVGDIGAAVEETLKGRPFSIISGLTGHGVGFGVHEDPTVYNYGKKGEGMLLVPGLVLAIEPMLAMGGPEIFQEKDDSFRTRDRSLSAQFEHTVLITARGVEILTE